MRATKTITELVPGDRFIYHHFDQAVIVEFIGPLLDATDRFGQSMLRFQARRRDTGQEGSMMFGKKTSYRFTMVDQKGFDDGSA